MDTQPLTKISNDFIANTRILLEQMWRLIWSNFTVAHPIHDTEL